MALSRLAREFAAEIRAHDWSDSPYRSDRAGHRREDDKDHESKPRLDEKQTGIVQLNVAWVVGQVLGHAGLLTADDIYEWADACGCQTSTLSGRPRSGHIKFGFRWRGDGVFAAPPVDPEPELVDEDISDDWDEIDFADPTGLEYPHAARLWNGWLKHRDVQKRVTASAISAYAQQRSNEADEDYVPLGALRSLFIEYYRRVHEPPVSWDSAPF